VPVAGPGSSARTVKTPQPNVGFLGGSCEFEPGEAPGFPDVSWRASRNDRALRRSLNKTAAACTGVQVTAVAAAVFEATAVVAVLLLAAKDGETRWRPSRAYTRATLRSQCGT